MLITINISFCVFSMPMAILQIVYYSDIYSSSSESVQASYMANNHYQLYQNKTLVFMSPNNFETSDQTVDLVDLLHTIAELLQYLNHGSNFIFYSMSGKTFRNETKRFFCKKLNYFKALFRSKLCLIRCSIGKVNKFSSSVY